MPLPKSAREAQHRYYLRHRDSIIDKVRDARKAEMLRYKNNPEALREHKAEEALKYQNYLKSKIDKHLQVMLERDYPDAVKAFIREAVIPYKGNLGVSFINKIVVLADALAPAPDRPREANICPNTLKETRSPLQEAEDTLN
jgi:hypothetical protein